MAIKPINVSQLNSYIKRILQTDPLLGNISVIGEISNLKYHHSGHIYFNLKDDKSKINCFLSSSNAEYIAFELNDGMEVTLTGNISLYEPGGYYSINVVEVEVAGKGDLSVAFEELKNKLDKEGLFDFSHKKEIPLFPNTVGIITAESGAAVEDIMKIIKKKNNYVDILLFSVTVQGPKAAPEISAAIEKANKDYPYIDTIILGRGGGSIEDLWAFNEEIVARAIYNSKIPIISAVGHEIDFTISDFVADMRAETPTAAANMAVPDINIIKENILTLKDNLKNNLDMFFSKKEKQIEDMNIHTFSKIIGGNLNYYDLKIDGLKNTMETNISQLLKTSSQKIEMLWANLEDRSPLKIMEKGYAAVTNDNGILIDSINKIKKDENLTLSFADGKVDVKTLKIRESGGKINE